MTSPGEFRGTRCGRVNDGRASRSQYRLDELAQRDDHAIEPRNPEKIRVSPFSGESSLEAGRCHVRGVMGGGHFTDGPHQGIHIAAHEPDHSFAKDQFLSLIDGHIGLALIVAADEFHRAPLQSSPGVDLFDGVDDSLMDFLTVHGELATEGIDFADTDGVVCRLSGGSTSRNTQQYQEVDDSPVLARERSPLVAPG